MKPIRRRAVGEAVVDVQTRLSNLGYSLGARGIDGHFGAATERAVSAFQKDCGISQTGVLDQKTWWELVERSYELGDRLLYLRWPFLRGADVLQLQELLATLGFRVGPVDGIFGPATDKAVREFQRNLLLPLDGIVGTATLGALKNLLNILKIHPRTLMPWSLVRPQEKNHFLAGSHVVIEYYRSADTVILKGRKHLAAQMASLLRVAGARVRVRGVNDGAPYFDGYSIEELRQASGPSYDRTILVGVGFPVAEPSSDISLVYPAGDATVAELAENVRLAVGRIAGRQVQVNEREQALLQVPGIFIVMPHEEKELLGDESLRQRMAVAIVDSIGQSSTSNGAVSAAEVTISS